MALGEAGPEDRDGVITALLTDPVEDTEVMEDCLDKVVPELFTVL